MTAVRRWSTVGLAVAVVLVVDQLTKRWAVDRLRGQPPIDVFWTLRLVYAENTGMAFSKGSGMGNVIALVVVAIVVVLVVVARRMTSPLQLVLVGVVIGGALGNLADRVFRAENGFLSGGVVDFIDVQWWPIFNVADACVVVGGIALALTGLREPTTEDESADVASGEASGPPE
jgi:signal peptidase II